MYVCTTKSGFSLRFRTWKLAGGFQQIRITEDEAVCVDDVKQKRIYYVCMYVCRKFYSLVIFVLMNVSNYLRNITVIFPAKSLSSDCYYGDSI